MKITFFLWVCSLQIISGQVLLNFTIGKNLLLEPQDSTESSQFGSGQSDVGNKEFDSENGTLDNDASDQEEQQQEGQEVNTEEMRFLLEMRNGLDFY